MLRMGFCDLLACWESMYDAILGSLFAMSPRQFSSAEADVSR